MHTTKEIQPYILSEEAEISIHLDDTSSILFEEVERLEISNGTDGTLCTIPVGVEGQNKLRIVPTGADTYIEVVNYSQIGFIDGATSERKIFAARLKNECGKSWDCVPVLTPKNGGKVSSIHFQHKSSFRA